MAYIRRYTRLVPLPQYLRTVRDLLREHLNHARKTQEDLARMWGMQPSSARRLLSPRPGRRNEIKPYMLDAVIAELRLDADDAYELHYHAALEAGYKIQRPK